MDVDVAVEDEIPYLQIPELTEVTLRNHQEKVRRSEGFDADVVVDWNFEDVGPRRLTKFQLNNNLDKLKRLCDKAILEYNTKHDTKLKVGNVVQANFEPAYRPHEDGYGDDYYISFTTVDESSSAAAAAPYQAKVFAPWSFSGDTPLVKLCRPKPSTSS